MRELAADTLIDDRYRVISRIGSGGMADVYCAEDLQLGRRVAVKLLSQRFAEDHEFVERFRREASSAASLSHPNVVSVFDRGEWDGTYYIAMEYLPGRSLKELVRTVGAIAPLEAIDLTLQVLEAARFAHRRGVVHRDIKPLNVIVDEDSRVKVTDFGIARAGASEITQTGSIMGTAQYLSPEQAQGHAVSPQSDLYSIGILLYELLTGHVPFDGESAVAIALKQISETPPPPSSVNPLVTTQLDAIVARALAKDTADRFADADEFIAALSGERGRLASTPEEHTQQLQAVMAAYQASAPEQPQQSAWQDESEVVEEEWAPLEEGEERPLWPWIVGGLVVVGAAVAIVLVLLSGSSKLMVPNVVGQTQQNATGELQSEGLVATPFQEPNSAAVGTVVSQSPGAGAQVAKSSQVQLMVSSGPGSVQIPDVGGEAAGAAKRQLRKTGFQVTTIQASSTAVQEGSVISTDPPALTSSPAGSVVQMTVSSGPPPQPVPGVVGKSQADAETILQAGGFNATVTEQQTNSQTPGTVLSQTPSAGEQAKPGSTVVITVSQTPTKIAVPDLVGQTAVQAAATLGADKLKPLTTTEPVSDPTQDGVVQSQTPAAASNVKPGSTVSLVVGQYSSQATGSSGSTGATG